jgi:hypothetical protein
MWTAVPAKPGPIYPLLVPLRDGPGLFAGEAFNIVAVMNRLCFLLARRGNLIGGISRRSSKTLPG